MEIDVHGFTRLEAKEYILENIDKCYKAKNTTLVVIHGSTHGTAIRDWLRASKTLGDKVVSVEPHWIFSCDKTVIKIKLR